MIRKIIEIKNYSKFSNFNIKDSDWDGVLHKTNVVYAPNGSGKTSLSVMFRSLCNEPSLINKKKSFNSENLPEIKLLDIQNKEIKFNKKWNCTKNNIEIFDSYYTENNMYIITINNDINQLNLFDISAGKEVFDLIAEQKLIRNERKKLTNRRKALKSEKKLKGLNEYKTEKYESICSRINGIDIRIKEIDKLRLELTHGQRLVFLQKINNYLSLFTENIQLTELMQRNAKILVYGISVNGKVVRTDKENTISLKLCLSEGDKNALALSFFLAKMEMVPNISDYLVVIDDPFTSFDHHRKLTTIKNIARLNKKFGKLILLTHDLNFANEFSSNIEGDLLNLKICNKNGTSMLVNHDIKSECLTGIFKDITILNNFITFGNTNNSNLRDIIRSIRPAIEGLFRIKFFSHISSNEWLGDFLVRIRESEPGTPFFRLRDLYEEISEINDYSKIYHHSNPDSLEYPINENELKGYVKRTIKVMELI